MAETIGQGNGGLWSPWRIAGWGFAASLLVLPAAAMQFTREVDWTAFDFIFAAALIGGVGIVFEVAVRMTRSVPYRAAVAAALASAFLIVWVNGAVGMIGSEHSRYNLLFLGVIVLALAGAATARFRAAGTARAMIAAAVAQAAIGVVGMSADLLGGVLSTALAVLWLVSAALFRKAASDGAARG